MLSVVACLVGFVFGVALSEGITGGAYGVREATPWIAGAAIVATVLAIVVEPLIGVGVLGLGLGVGYQLGWRRFRGAR